MSSAQVSTRRERFIHVGMATIFDMVATAALLYCIYGAYVSLAYQQSVWTHWTETHTFLVFMTGVASVLSFLIHNAHHRENCTAQFSLARAIGGTVGLAVLAPPVLLAIPMLFVGASSQDIALRWLILAIAISPVGYRGVAYRYYELSSEEEQESAEESAE